MIGTEPWKRNLVQKSDAPSVSFLISAFTRSRRLAGSMLNSIYYGVTPNIPSYSQSSCHDEPEIHGHKRQYGDEADRRSDVDIRDRDAHEEE